MGEKKGTSVWGYLAVIVCIILPLFGLVFFLTGALYGSINIFFIGLFLFIVPLFIVGLVIVIRDSIKGKRGVKVGKI